MFIATNEKRLQNQVYIQVKSKLMGTFRSGKSSLFERVDFSLYRFLSSLSNLNNILTLPKLLPSLKQGLILQELSLPCFLPTRFMCMRASLRNQTKCKPSIKAPLLISCRTCYISLS